MAALTPARPMRPLGRVVAREGEARQPIFEPAHLGFDQAALKDREFKPVARVERAAGADLASLVGEVDQADFDLVPAGKQRLAAQAHGPPVRPALKSVHLPPRMEPVLT